MILCQKWHTSSLVTAPKVALNLDLVPEMARRNAEVTCNA
jgi:hypothetical protein